MQRLAVGLAIAVLATLGTVAAWQRLHAPAPDAASPAAASAATGASAVPPPQTVGLAVARTRDVPVVLEASGSVVPLETVDIRPQTASTVRAVHLKDGQVVRQGDLLFTLDDRVDRARLDQARQQALRDRATLADAQRQLARAQDLAAQHFVSPSAVDTARAAVEAAQAAVNADEAAVRAAEASLSYGQVRAPQSGRAGLVAVHPGALVTPTGAALVTLSRLDRVAVQFSVPEADVPALLQGVAAGARVEALPGRDAAIAGTGTEPVAVGRLVFADNAIDPASGTLRAKAEFANPAQALWPGQFVRVRLVLRTLAGAVVVPQAALVQRATARGVYVAGPDGAAQWRPVTVLQALDDVVAVQGVQAGERVVVEGRQNVRPGTPLREAGASAPRGASGAGPRASTAARAGSRP